MHADGSWGCISFVEIGTWFTPDSPSAYRQSFRASVYYGAGVSSCSYNTIQIEAGTKPRKLGKFAETPVNTKSGDSIHAVQKWRHSPCQEKHATWTKTTGDIFCIGTTESSRSYDKDSNMKQNKRSSAITAPGDSGTCCYCRKLYFPLTKLG